MTLSADRVRVHTASAVLRRIDDDTEDRLLRCAEQPPSELAARLDALDREWDHDRVVEVEASVTGLAGLALGALVDRRLLAIPGVVAATLLVHATTGWYPLLPLFRRSGVRTSREIARERYAVKALRGDFAALGAEPLPQPVASPPIAENVR